MKHLIHRIFLFLVVFSSLISCSESEDPVINLSVFNYNIAATGGTQILNVQANVDYEVIIDNSCKDWISVLSTRAMRDSKITLQISENEEIVERSGKVILKYKDVSQEIVITQQAALPSKNKMCRSAIFTVEKDGAGYTLYADYGGVVRPSNVLELTDGKGFNNGDRVLLVYSYTDDNIKTETGKGSYIDNAELISGQLIPINNILMREKAEASKLLEKDSIFSFANNVTSLQLSVYRGYLTASFNGRYSIVSGKGIYPSLNLVYDPTENERPNTLKLTAVYNRHTAADAQAGSQSFYISYPLSSFSHIEGSDPIEIIVDGLGFTEPLTTKVERVDMTPGNYLYFQ